MNLLYIAVGGALGSVMRFLMQSAIGHWLGNAFPYGTMIVNISGSLIMGLFIGSLARFGSPHAETLRYFVAIGILGGYTTFSSFSLDSITLMENGELMKMSVYIISSVVCSLLGLLIGLHLMRSFS